MRTPQVFADRVLAWFDVHGRKDLPWQHPRSPYRVWVSEVMLQQTQVATVIPYFERFIARFPDIAALASADADDVMSHWAGLGYYARARNLQRAAQLVVEKHGGELPRDFEALHALPGIGRSTAGAILAQSHDQRHAILDGNVKRLLSRYHAVEGWPGLPAVQRKLWAFAEQHTPHERMVDFTQAMMDLGATVCARRPRCEVCPLSDDCRAHALKQERAFPAARPKRARPARETRMLLLSRGGEILLERRPPAGIWGGLWCLPELSQQQTPRRYCERIGINAGRFTRLGSVQHGFTHFDLTIRPLHAKVRAGSSRVAEPGALRWHKLRDFAADSAPGVPAPVRKLLHQILERNA
jgi:A/G-specific adenine glycosylase